MKVESSVLMAPLGLQALAMVFDELHYHRKRGLETWERLGHPLDTLTVIACMAFIVLVPPGPRAIAAYLVLAAFSCAFITKDEIVHARRCSPGEHRLHALLFVLHPLCLASLGLMWPAVHQSSDGGMPFVPIQLLITSAFCLYQLLYWNIPWPT